MHSFYTEMVLDKGFATHSYKATHSYSSPDNGHSFDNILFYGNELTLVVFDTLFFCITDLIVENFVLAGVITFLATEV